MASYIKRYEASANPMPSSTGKSNIGHKNFSNENLDNLPVLRDYNTIVTSSLASFVASSRKIGGELSTMIDHVERLFRMQQEFLRQAVQNKKPTNDQQLTELIKPQSTEIEAIVAFTNRNRKSTFFNHLSSISEGIPALGWILVSPTPAPHIKEMLDAAQFYTNRVLKDFKDKDPIHNEWVKQWIKTLNELHAYVKQYHTTGLVWNSTGQHQSNANLSSFSNIQIDDSSSRNGVKGAINALGGSATSHLKKTSDESKVYRNPPVERSNKSQIVTSSASSHSPSGVPKLALEGNKWIVEYYSNRTDLRITETNMRQTIYIYKCSNSTITVQGKVNSIVLDQCTKVGIQFTSVVSLIEFINCRAMKVQVLDSVPTIQIEKTDGCHVYLSKSSLNTEFITSKSSEMTINVPFGDGEYKEYPIPEQFKTHLQHGKQPITVPNESAGV